MCYRPAHRLQTREIEFSDKGCLRPLSFAQTFRILLELNGNFSASLFKVRYGGGWLATHH